MCREFSSENVFAFIECVQFKHRAAQLLRVSDTEHTQQKYVLYKHIPKSSIVFGQNGDASAAGSEASDLKQTDTPDVDSASAVAVDSVSPSTASPSKSPNA